MRKSAAAETPKPSRGVITSPRRVARWRQGRGASLVTPATTRARRRRRNFEIMQSPAAARLRFDLGPAGRGDGHTRKKKKTHEPSEDKNSASSAHRLDQRSSTRRHHRGPRKGHHHRSASSGATKKSEATAANAMRRVCVCVCTISARVIREGVAATSSRTGYLASALSSPVGGSGAVLVHPGAAHNDRVDAANKNTEPPAPSGRRPRRAPTAPWRKADTQLGRRQALRRPALHCVALRRNAHKCKWVNARIHRVGASAGPSVCPSGALPTER